MQTIVNKTVLYSGHFQERNNIIKAFIILILIRYYKAKYQERKP